MQKNEHDKMIEAGAKRLRGIIRGELREKGEASLVFVICKFDWKEHAIPYLDELNQALSAFIGKSKRMDADIVFTESAGSDAPMVLQKEDHEFLLRAYQKRMKEA